ncbi:hypothetical protein DPMN_118637 [Dreissena polymorpha]|uniref:Uncharacterized protein n=1 Tax=Dreissena polymorpha TaxID=45954 RepID=A0A9D4GKG3_DREPO|nr:hypothetical protein DPMN_118637 [Dreissena polymorpha]
MKCDFYIFDPAQPNFKLGQDFIGTKLQTKFHEDGTRNVASRVFMSKCLPTNGHTTDKDRSQKLTNQNKLLTRVYYSHIWTNCPALWWPCFQPKRIHFQLIQDIIWAHYYKFYYRHIWKNCPAPWWPCFQPKRTHFQLIQDIIWTHVLTKFHEEWTKIKTSRVSMKPFVILGQAPNNTVKLNCI